MSLRFSLAVSRAFPSGAWMVSAVVNGTRESRTYFDYTKAEAVADFLAEFSSATERA